MAMSLTSIASGLKQVLMKSVAEALGEDREGEYSGESNAEGKRHGWGVMKYSDGDTYKGNWVNGMAQGQGTYIFANGEKYVGGFQSNQYHGTGKRFYDVDGLEYFEGNFIKGERDRGKLIYANGASHEGGYKANMCEEALECSSTKTVARIVASTTKA